MKKAFTLIAMAFLTLWTGQSKAQTFQVEDVPVGNPSLKYFDPEFQSSVNKMVFQSVTNNTHTVWIANLDPLTGLFVSGDGYDLQIDSAIASVGPKAQTSNGPEWGIDNEGVAVFYSKPDGNGIIQYWKAENLENGKVKITKLTDVVSPNGEGAIQGVVRQDASRPTTQFVYRYSTGVVDSGQTRWADENRATEINPIPNFNGASFAPSWIPGTEDFVYGRLVSQGKSDIARYYTDTKTFKDLTNEPNVYKKNIIAFKAPEYNNELMMLCVADNKAIAVYRDLGNGYQRFYTITPEDSQHPYVYSPELCQVNGKTYFTVLAVDSADYLTATDGAIYFIELGADTTRLIRRIDNGLPANRFEPEMYIGSEEVFVFFNVGGDLRRARTGIKINKNQPKPKQLDFFSFEKDYFPGTYDANGKYLSGTELMRLTSHKGKLYASTSTFLDSFFVKRYSYYTGAQILRKDYSNGSWYADLSLGVEYLRADCLESIRFTHDSTGVQLTSPENILIAGIWDVAFNRQKMVSVAIRNDEENRWIISSIDKNADNDQGSVRSMIVHRDKVTGVQYLFLGAGVGRIYKGVYDPGLETKIRWVGGNELDFDAGRVQSMTVCNDILYAAFGYSDSQSPGGDKGGLFKRIDGMNPKWQLVYSWEHNPNGKFEYLLRGISTVVDPENNNNQVLIGALEKPPLPVIRRINPSRGYEVTEEINYEEYFTLIFGAKPNPNQYMNAAILNKLEPFVNPQTGESEHLVTTFIMHPLSPDKGFNGAYYMLRHIDASYDWGSIYDSANLPTGVELQGVRTIEKSPFTDEPTVYYFGGYAADYENVKNTAWIYKGIINQSTVIEKKDNELFKRYHLNQNYPNPFNPSTVISYQLSAFSHVSLKVYDVLGREVATLVDEHKQAGSYNFQLSILNYQLPSGVFFYQLKTGNFNETKKMMVVK